MTWRDALNGKYEAKLTDYIKFLKQNSTSEYDCMIGLSGGLDSSYMLHKLVADYGLKPLCLHVDAGWNTHVAITNINKLVSSLGVDLKVVVIDWNEIKELQLAFLRSNVSQQDTPQDHAFFATLYDYALRLGLRTIVSGSNLSSEAVQVPLEWIYYPSDIRQLNDIERRFCRIPLSKFPKTSVIQKKIISRYFGGIREFHPLNLFRYIKSEAQELLTETYGFTTFAEKHYESIFTKYYEAIYLPSKFGFDTRKVTYSSMILTGQMDRHTALERLSKPALSETDAKNLESFVADKLQISLDEMVNHRKSKGVSHRKYKNQEKLYNLGSTLVKLIPGYDSSGAKR